MISKLNQQRTRLGTAAAETAVILPIVVMVMLGSIELCGGVHQQCRARAVMHECSKLAAKGEASSTDVRIRAQAMLSQLGIDTYAIDITVVPRTVNQTSVAAPTVTAFTISSGGAATPGLEDVPRGTLLRMSLNADRPSITTGLTSYLGSQIETSCVFVKEI